MPPTLPSNETMDFLLAQVSRLHQQHAHDLLEKINLYRGQPPLLYALWDQDGQTHGELAEKLQVTPATITRMIQRMEKAGFVQRRPDPADQRVSRAYLTEAGRAVQAGVQTIWAQMEAESFAGFSPEELALLRDLLQRIRANLLHATGGKKPL
jgi:MarR family transcriptional regulator, organic hydroperoxide resistance regulator